MGRECALHPQPPNQALVQAHIQLQMDFQDVVFLPS